MDKKGIGDGMNSKTAKLINKVARGNRQVSAAMKRQWNATPRPYRHKLREIINIEIDRSFA